MEGCRKVKVMYPCASGGFAVAWTARGRKCKNADADGILEVLDCTAEILQEKATEEGY